MLRIFLAIFLPENLIKFLKKEIQIITKKINHFNFKIVPENQWHITLYFFGNQNYENIDKIKKSIILLKNFKLDNTIKFEKIIYGPINSFKKRMVWCITSKQTNNNLEKYKNYLSDIFQINNLNLQKEKRKFCGHITLIRFQNKLEKQLPFLNKEIFFEFKFYHIFLIQSIFKKNGVEYKKLFKINIK